MLHGRESTLGSAGRPSGDRTSEGIHARKPERDVSGLAEQTGLSRGTVHRLLAALESEALPVRRDNGLYRLGPTAAAPGVRALRSSTLRETAHPELERFGRTNRRDRDTRSSLRREDAHSRRSARRSIDRSVAFTRDRVGTACDVDGEGDSCRCSDRARGRALAALAGPLFRENDHRPPRLDEALDEALANGYATAREELAKGYSAAGAVIRTPMLKPYAALSLRGPSARLHPDVLEELGARVKSCADAVPARLGYEG